MNKSIVTVISVIGIIAVLMAFGYWRNQVRLAKKEVVNTEKKIFCTTFPVYLFTKAVTGDVDRHVELLLPPNLGCPHDYSLTPGDLNKLRGNGDILVKNGLQLDDVICHAALRANYSLQIVDSGNNITDLIPSANNGDEYADEHDEGCTCGGTHTHGSNNPHLFGSPFQAIRMVRNIGEQLQMLDPVNADAYRKNMEAYQAELEKLCHEFTLESGKWSKRSFAAQHDVFSYLIRDLKLEEGVLVRASAESAPSTAEVMELIQAIKEKKINVIFTEPQYPPALSEMIAREAGIKADTLDPVASGPQDAAPEYYLETMRKNLETLTRYLK